MTRPTTLVLAALVLLLPGAAVHAEATTATTQPATAGVRHLQGTWEGVLVGQESAGKITNIGKVIGAVFKIENGTLSLAGIEDDGTSDDSEAFDGNTMFHYRFGRVEPQAKKAGAPEVP